VLSGAKRLDGLQSGGSADGEQGQVVGAAQQQRMLVALSRSERQARYQLQVVQQELLTVTKAAAVLASRCRQLLRGSVVLEGTVMTMCDPLVRKHPVGSVCAAFTQTNNPQPGEKGAGGWSAASVLSGMGFVLGGSREH
jgi:hypothetical protein